MWDCFENEEVVESELYGARRGAFSGAVEDRPGLVRAAHGGTLFLDEIAEISPSLQAQLLRFLQDRVDERVGGRERIAVDVRIVCATNKDLPKLIERTEFREDLLYRISEVTVRIPPLRERHGDAVVIAQSVMERRAREHGRPLRGFSPDALSAMQSSRGRVISASSRTTSTAP